MGKVASSVLVWGKVSPWLGSPSFENMSLTQESTGLVLSLCGGQRVRGRAISWEEGIAAPELGWGQDRGVLDFGLSWDCGVVPDPLPFSREWGGLCLAQDSGWSPAQGQFGERSWVPGSLERPRWLPDPASLW